MLTIETNTRHFFKTFDIAASLACVNNEQSEDWTYVCESIDDEKTWSVAIYDEENIKIGYL